MSAERWLPIDMAPGYEVSDQGRVRSFKRGAPRVLAQTLNPGNGRPQAHVADRNPWVHTLVARAFLGPRPEGQQIRHLDGNKLNNHIENLVYGTRSENALDQVRHGVHHMARKTHCPSGHLYTEENTRREARGRHCRTCDRARWNTNTLPGGNTAPTSLPCPTTVERGRGS